MFRVLVALALSTAVPAAASARQLPSGVSNSEQATVIEPTEPEREPLAVTVQAFIGSDRERFGQSGEDISRLASVTSLRLDVPLSPSTALFFVMPYVHQSRAVMTAQGQTRSIVGGGFGDARIGATRAFDTGAGWTSTLELTLKLATGSASSGPADLPSGTGTTEGFATYRAERQMVPINIAGEVTYGTSIGRRVGATDTYGGQLGVVFPIGPSYTFQSSINFYQLNSPILFTTAAHTAYLVNDFSIHTGSLLTITLSAGAGLTDDSLKFVGSFSVRIPFKVVSRSSCIARRQ